MWFVKLQTIWHILHGTHRVRTDCSRIRRAETRALWALYMNDRNTDWAHSAGCVDQVKTTTWWSYCHDWHVALQCILATLSCWAADSVYYVIYVIRDFILATLFATLFCFESQFMILRYTRHFCYPLYKYTQVCTNVRSASRIRRDIRHRFRQNLLKSASSATRHPTRQTYARTTSANPSSTGSTVLLQMNTPTLYKIKLEVNSLEKRIMESSAVMLEWHDSLERSDGAYRSSDWYIGRDLNRWLYVERNERITIYLTLLQ
jgi:hypothetical protein